jgi:hypothetical protein
MAECQILLIDTLSVYPKWCEAIASIHLENKLVCFAPTCVDLCRVWGLPSSVLSM